MKRNTFILSLIMLLFCLADLHSQILAVKSDLLTGALSSPNFGVVVKLSNRLTLEAGFHYNPFPAGGDKRGNIGLCSLNCATGCASPLAGTSSVRICCTEYIMWEV